MAKHRLTEDFLDALDAEDIVQTDDNLKSYDPEKYPLSMMLYVSPFVISNPRQSAHESTSAETIQKMYNKIVFLYIFIIRKTIFIINNISITIFTSYITFYFYTIFFK